MNIFLTDIQQNAGVDSIALLIFFLTLMAFVIGWAINRIMILRIRKNAQQIKELSSIMQHTLKVNKNYVVRISMHERLAVNMHGDFLPDNGINYVDSLNYIHPNDRQAFTECLNKLSHGEKTAECTFRWDWSLDAHKSDWHYIYNSGIAEYANDNQRMPTTIFCTLTDQTEQILQEMEEQEMADRYRKIFEMSLVGLAFYDKDGKLIGANQKMREILKFQSEDDPFYFSHTLFEMPSFRNMPTNHKIEDLYFCTKSVIIERGVNCYTELRLHPILDEDKKLVYITFSIRDVTQERELYLQNKKNDEFLRQTNKEIQQYETELQYLMDHADMRFFRTSFEKKEVTFYKSMSVPESSMNFDKLIAHFINDDFANGLRDPYNFFKEPKSTLTHMHPFFHEKESLQWNFIDSVPYFDKEGKLLGTYGIVRNVTDLLYKQEQLKQETERASQSGLRKSTFMANMTHEIRTPLNAIVGFSDVLPMLSTPEEKKEIIRVITNNCDMLLRLVNDILAVSSLDKGNLDIIPKETDFAKDFNDIATSLAQRIQTPEVEFIKENPFTSFETILDSDRIQQVITNFVTNAIKYTKKGYIKIGYRQEKRDEKDGLYIYCEDTGTGIPYKDQEKVFERFVKLNDYVQGTGLGLSICHAIAKSCQGQIGVLSDGEGTGSTFWFWLPCENLKKEI